MARHTVSKDAYLRILNETLTHHPAYSDGMAFQNILLDCCVLVDDRRSLIAPWSAVAWQIRR